MRESVQVAIISEIISQYYIKLRKIIVIVLLTVKTVKRLTFNFTC